MTTIHQFLDQLDPPVRRLVEQFGWEIGAFLPGIHIDFDESARIIAYGFGPKYADLICTAIPSKKGLKIGFYKGSELDDPEGLLTGSGKVHRYVEIVEPGVLESPAFRTLILQAYQRYRERSGGN
jgi:hypothetical protein